MEKGGPLQCIDVATPYPTSVSYIKEFHYADSIVNVDYNYCKEGISWKKILSFFLEPFFMTLKRHGYD